MCPFEHKGSPAIKGKFVVFFLQLKVNVFVSFLQLKVNVFVFLLMILCRI